MNQALPLSQDSCFIEFFGIIHRLFRHGLSKVGIINQGLDAGHHEVHIIWRH